MDVATIDISSHSGGLWLNGRPFQLKGISWFGFETSDGAVLHGLWARTMDHYLDLLAAQSFNALRIPFALELALNPEAVRPTNVDYYQNADLRGLTSIEVLDVLVRKAAARGILIVLDMHHMGFCDGIPELWYDEARGYPQSAVLRGWQYMVSRYLGCWNVVGADLNNEPHGAATWGTGDLATDWRAAAQVLGNTLLDLNPRLLILVEGTERPGRGPPPPGQCSSTAAAATSAGHCSDIARPPAFWGNDLSLAKHLPVVLSNPDKLVYSPHVYGPDVYGQPYFSDPRFPSNLPDVWRYHWAHLAPGDAAATTTATAAAAAAVAASSAHPVGCSSGTSSSGTSSSSSRSEAHHRPAVVLGEWGGHAKAGSADRAWHEALASFLLQAGCTSNFYWCLNPNSHDTGGLLQDDWVTLDPYKADLLRRVCPHPTCLPSGTAAPDVRIAAVQPLPPRQAHDVAEQLAHVSINAAAAAGAQPEQHAPAAVAMPAAADSCHHHRPAPQGQQAAVPAGNKPDSCVGTGNGSDGGADSPQVVVGRALRERWDKGGETFYLFDCTLANEGNREASGVRLVLDDPSVLSEVWCMEPSSDGMTLTLPGWLEGAALAPGQVHSWGCIAKRSDFGVRTADGCLEAG